MNLGWPNSVVDAACDIVDLLGRLPAIERSVSAAAERAQETLDEILEKLRPIEMELDELRGTADELRSKTESLQRTAAPLEDSMSRLTERAAAIEGALEHALDRVPGLSAEDARERAQSPPPIEIT